MTVSYAAVEAASGAVASVISLLATYPLKTIYTLQAISAVNGGGKGSSAAPSAASLGILALVRKYKLRGLYVGIEPNIVESALSSACYFYLYAKLRDIAVRQAQRTVGNRRQLVQPQAVTTGPVPPLADASGAAESSGAASDDNASSDTFISANSASRTGSTAGIDSVGLGKEHAAGAAIVSRGNDSNRSGSEAGSLAGSSNGGSSGDSTQDQSIGVLASLIVAALAGIGNQLITMPVSLVATRIQSSQKLLPSGKVSRPHSLRQVVANILREDGVLGFWKGLLPALVLVSNPAIQYMLYEQFLLLAKQWKVARAQRAAHAAAKPLGAADSILSTKGGPADAASAALPVTAAVSETPLQNGAQSAACNASQATTTAAVSASTTTVEGSQGPSTHSAVAGATNVHGGSGRSSSSSSSSGIGSGSGGTYGVSKYVNVGREGHNDEHGVVDEEELQRMEHYYVESQQQGAASSCASAAAKADANPALDTQDSSRDSIKTAEGSPASAVAAAATEAEAALDKSSETANALAGAVTGGAAGAAAGVVSGSAASAVGAAVAGVMVGAVASGVTGAAAVAVVNALTSKAHSCSHKQAQQPHTTVSMVAVQGVKLSPWEIFLTSSAAKIGATVATYPLIVVKSRLQAASRASDPHLRYNSAADAVRQILAHEGLAGFFGGLEAKVYQTALGAGLTLMLKDRVGTAVRSVLAPKQASMPQARPQALPGAAAPTYAAVAAAGSKAAAAADSTGGASGEGTHTADDMADTTPSKISGSCPGGIGSAGYRLAGRCGQACAALGASEEVAARTELLVALLLQQAKHVVAR